MHNNNLLTEFYVIQSQRFKLSILCILLTRFAKMSVPIIYELEFNFTKIVQKINNIARDAISAFSKGVSKPSYSLRRRPFFVSSQNSGEEANPREI